MKNILQEQLLNKINESKSQKLDGQKILNSIKQYLHIILLNYLFSHKTYKHCVMFGGSVLKLLYNIPRMSIDLDFQVNFNIKKDEFKNDIINFFNHKYGYKNLEVNIRQSEEKDTDTFWIVFPELNSFKIPEILYTKLKIRLDFNKFATDKFKQILVPRIGENYNFYLRTYPIATLMASKIVATLQRIQYTVSNGKESFFANYKGRDIYDIVWYVQKGIIPNLTYLANKGLIFDNYPSLFKAIKERLNDLNDGGKALKTDLTHLHLNPNELDVWMKNWKQYFLGGMQNYYFIKVEKLTNSIVLRNFDTGNFIFNYYYKTQEKKEVIFRIEISELFILDFPLNSHIRKDIIPQIDFKVNAKDLKTVLEYAGLFYSKIEDYIKRINYIVPKLELQTKFIQLRHEGFEPNTRVMFSDKELISCRLEDLF